MNFQTLPDEEDCFCCLCGPGPTAPYDEIEGRMFVRCNSCGLVFQSPRMAHIKILEKGLQYDREYFFTQTGRRENTSEKMNRARQKLFHKELVLLQKFSKGRRIFDVGCGTGRFLDFLTDEWDRHGCDISSTAVAICREKYGLQNVRLGEFEELEIPEASFDVVYFRASLHHTYNPLTSIEKAARILKKDGCMVIFANCRDGLSGRLLKCRTRSVNERVTHFFSEKDVDNLMKRVGFSCIKTFAPYWRTGYEKPMDFPELILGFCGLRIVRPILKQFGHSIMDSWIGPAWLKNSQFYYFTRNVMTGHS